MFLISEQMGKSLNVFEIYLTISKVICASATVFLVGIKDIVVILAREKYWQAHNYNVHFEWCW